MPSMSFLAPAGVSSVPSSGEAAGALGTWGWAAPLPLTGSFTLAQSSLEGVPFPPRSPHFPRVTGARSQLFARRRPGRLPAATPREAGGRGKGAGRGRRRWRRRWRSGRGARPAGRQGEAGGAGQPRLSPRGAAGRPYCGAVCGGSGASPLQRPSAPTTASPSQPRRPAPQRSAPATLRREDPLAVGVSRWRPPFALCCPETPRWRREVAGAPPPRCRGLSRLCSRPAAPRRRRPDHPASQAAARAGRSREAQPES